MFEHLIRPQRQPSEGEIPSYDERIAFILTPPVLQITQASAEEFQNISRFLQSKKQISQRDGGKRSNYTAQITSLALKISGDIDSLADAVNHLCSLSFISAAKKQLLLSQLDQAKNQTSCINNARSNSPPR